MFDDDLQQQAVKRKRKERCVHRDGSWDKNILMDSEAKLFLITGCVFLCVSYVLMKLFYVTEPNDLLHCVIDGMYVNDRLDTVLEIAGTGQGP